MKTPNTPLMLILWNVVLKILYMNEFNSELNKLYTLLIQDIKNLNI